MRPTGSRLTLEQKSKAAVATAVGSTAYLAGIVDGLLRPSQQAPTWSTSAGAPRTAWPFQSVPSRETTAAESGQAGTPAAEWLQPADEQEEAEQQTLTDVCTDAASWLSHPHRDVLVTVAAGGISGAVAKTAIAPLARLTILYQVHALQPVGNKAPSLLAALQQVARQEGLASLWKGNLATILHRMPYSAANFTTFEASKAVLEPHVQSDVARRLLAGAAAGLVACTVAYPLDLVRTRLSAQRDMLPHTTRLTVELMRSLGVTPDPTQPTHLAAAGPLPANPACARAPAASSSAGLFPWRPRNVALAAASARGGTPRGTAAVAAAGATHVAAAATVEEAAAAARARLPPSLRMSCNYRGITHAFRCILREEGVRGLYRGLGATLLQVTPSLALNFCLYDSLRAWYLCRHHHDPQHPDRQAIAPADSQLLPSHAAATLDHNRPQSVQWGASQQLGSGLAHQHLDQRGVCQAEDSQPGWAAAAAAAVVLLPPAGAGACSAAGEELAAAGGCQHPLAPCHCQLGAQGRGQHGVAPGASAGGATLTAQRPLQQPGREVGGVGGRDEGRGSQLDLQGSLLCASVSGFVTSTATFPLDVLRKRMQTQRGGLPLSYVAACRQLLAQRGPQGFYAGIAAEYAKVVPGMAIAFTLYEAIRNLGGVQHRS